MRMMSRPMSRLVPALVLAAPGLTQAPVSASEPLPNPANDPLLDALIKEALDRHPDLQKAESDVQMEQERIPQAGVLPDPTLSLGLQNDGFKKIQVGHMETSFYSLAFTQPLPWPGKRNLRKDIAARAVEVSEANRWRIRLSIEAEVRRGYTALLLIRGQRELQAQQRLFLEQAEQLARTRYEVGQGSQGDLLRAQLERTRLQQATWALEADETTTVASLNRLRLRNLDEPILTTTKLPQMADPEPPILERLEAQSPELAGALARVKQSEQQVALAKLDRRPDWALTAGVMPRGSLDPMWQVGISLSLPIYGRHKQKRAVAEHEHHRRSQGAEVASVRSLLNQRWEERSLQVRSLRRIRDLYQQGLLVQSEASFKAALAQYESGRTTFLSTLEALNGWVGDQGSYLQTLAQLQAQHIALAEAALGPTAPISGGSLGSASFAASGPAGSSSMSPTKAAGKPQEPTPAAMKM